MKLTKPDSDPHLHALLKESLEYFHCRRQFLLSLIPVGIFVLPVGILLILGQGNYGDGYPMAMCILLSLGFAGYSIYCLYRWREIFSHKADYMYFPVTLKNPVVYHSRYASAVAYEVRFPAQDGKLITRETAAMFHNESYPSLREFNGKTVQMAYNDQTDRLIVLHRQYESS